MTLLAVTKALTTLLIWHIPEATPVSRPLPKWWNGGRVYTSPHLHIGVRPALEWGSGGGFTVQITGPGL